jgi:hypothetical protein
VISIKQGRWKLGLSLGLLICFRDAEGEFTGVFVVRQCFPWVYRNKKPPEISTNYESPWFSQIPKQPIAINGSSNGV